MNILICADSLGIGGAETHVLQLAVGLSSLGHSVTVAAEYGALCPALFKSEGRVTFVRIPFAHRPTNAFLSLSRLMEQNKFDIVHAHSRSSALVAKAVLSLPSLSKSRIGFAVTAHAHYKSSPIKNYLSVWGDTCIAVSEDIRRHLIRSFGVPSHKIRVIRNGIDADIFSPRHLERNESFNILFASRLDSDCSLGASALCELATRLCATIPDLSITLAGGGNMFDRISAMANNVNKRLGRECIRCVGAVLDMPNLISKTDLAVGVSRFALEAMAMEKRVILFGNEGALGLFDESRLNRAINTNFTARGCEKADHDLLFDEIMKAYRLSESKKKALGQLGRKTVVTRYSGLSSVKETLGVYHSLLNKTKILLGGYYGFGNIGDETVMNTLYRSLKRKLPNAEIRALTAAPTCQSLHIDRRSFVNTVRALRKSDVYISGGGSLLQSKTSLRSLAYYCALISLARLFGCKVILAANGIGPLDGAISSAMARAAIMKSDHVSLRDPRSLELAKRLTHKKKRLYLSADPVFILPKLNLAKEKGSVAVSLRCEELRFPISDESICVLGERTIFVPMDTRFDIIESYPKNVTDVLSILSECSAAMGSRLHFLILAILSGIPIIPVGTDPKLVALSEMTLGIKPIDPEAITSISHARRLMTLYLKKNSGFDRDAFITKRRLLFEKDLDRIADICK